MAARLAGKVTVITGAARGQGRAHALRLAEEGSDIIALDICEPMETVNYPLGTKEELDDVVEQIGKMNRRAIGLQVDVRSRDQLKDALDQGIAELGGLHVVVANAGILPTRVDQPAAFLDAMDVDYGGAMNLVATALPHLSEGGSIICIGSTAGMIPGAVQNPRFGPGGSGYGLAKKQLIEYTEALALHLGKRWIRVNAVHPTNCDTALLHNEDMYKTFRPDLTNPTREDVIDVMTSFHALPIPYVDPVDIANAVLFFASDESRYITGVQLRVDAGALIKNSGGR
jgi:SDR family mycofactocin-dependent oxidoreductase